MKISIFNNLEKGKSNLFIVQSIIGYLFKRGKLRL